jgi:hypothetical protein
MSGLKMPRRGGAGELLQQLNAEHAPPPAPSPAEGATPEENTPVLLTGEQTGPPDGETSSKLTNKQDTYFVNRTTKHDIDPLVKVIVDKVTAPYPPEDKKALNLVAGRVPQEVSDRFDLVTQHLAKKSKQDALADALRLYIAHMAHQAVSRQED